MAVLSPKQSLRVDGVGGKCEDFLRQRALVAARINPALKPAVSPLVWQKAASVKRVLADTRIIDGASYRVVDVLVSEDEAKKAALLSESSEASLCRQVGPGSEKERGASGTIQGDARTLGSYYSCVDPTVGRFAELVALWAWWDLPDAIDLFLLDQICQRVEAIKTSGLSEAVKEAYRVALHRPAGAEVTRDDMLQCEKNNCDRVLKRFADRRETEDPCRAIVVADTDEPDINDETILEIATRLTAIQRIEQDKKLEPRARAYYSGLTGKRGAELTPESVIQYERENIRRLKAGLFQNKLIEDALPKATFDYKRRLLTECRQRCDRLCAK